MNFIHLCICIITIFAGTYRSDIPPSHVRVLDEILSNHINYSSIYETSMVDIILGRASSNRNNSNFDYRVLDHASLINIIKKTKTRYFDMADKIPVNSTQHDYRRQWYNDWWDTIKTTAIIVAEVVAQEAVNFWNEAVKQWNKFWGIGPGGIPYTYFYEKAIEIYDKKKTQEMIDRALVMIKQSIYSVRYRLQDTSRIRKRYENDLSYHIGTIVSNVHQLSLKCDNLYAQAEEFHERTHFLWYLIIYEKLLAADVDVTDLVKRAFQYHTEWQKIIHFDSNEDLK